MHARFFLVVICCQLPEQPSDLLAAFLGFQSDVVKVTLIWNPNCSSTRGPIQFVPLSFPSNHDSTVGVGW